MDVVEETTTFGAHEATTNAKRTTTELRNFMVATTNLQVDMTPTVTPASVYRGDVGLVEVCAVTRRMTRSEKTAQTTASIYTAITEEIVDHGWDGVTVSGVARRAGVTVGAMYSRAENVSEIANLLWSDDLQAPFESSVLSLIDNARSGDLQNFSTSAQRFDRYARSNSAVFDLAIASLFDDELSEVVQRDLTAFFVRTIYRTSDDNNHPVHAAATALLLCFFMGRALAIRARHRVTDLERSQLEVIASYWKASESRIDPSEIVPISFVRDDSPQGDVHTALYQGVLEVIAKWGYRRATISRIARATGMTPGNVLAHHPTKAALVESAARTLLRSPAEVWAQYQPVVQSLGPLRSRAAFLATFLDPVHISSWKLNIELARVAEFTPELAAFKTPNTTLEHTHLGVMFVACFVPGLVDLPFEGTFKMGSAT